MAHREGKPLNEVELARLFAVHIGRTWVNMDILRYTFVAYQPSYFLSSTTKFN